MTFKQMVRNLTQNSEHFLKQGDVAKAQICIELVAFIKERGYENIYGKLEFPCS
jgi:hypothetical protein